MKPYKKALLFFFILILSLQAGCINKNSNQDIIKDKDTNRDIVDNVSTKVLEDSSEQKSSINQEHKKVNEYTELVNNDEKGNYTIKIEFFLDENLPIRFPYTKYNFFEIYEIHNNKQNKVYEFDTSILDDGDFETFDLHDNDDDGIPELHFIMNDGINPSLLIIKKVENTYKEVFYGHAYNYSYEDVNKDGVKELLTGQTMDYISWWIGYDEVNQYIDDYYQPSYNLAKIYYQNMVESKKNQFESERTVDNFEELVDSYILLGDAGGLQKLIADNQDIIKVLESDFPALDFPPFDSYAHFSVSKASAYHYYWKERYNLN